MQSASVIKSDVILRLPAYIYAPRFMIVQIYTFIDAISVSFNNNTRFSYIPSSVRLYFFNLAVDPDEIQGLGGARLFHPMDCYSNRELAFRIIMNQWLSLPRCHILMLSLIFHGSAICSMRNSLCAQLCSRGLHQCVIDLLQQQTFRKTVSVVSSGATCDGQRRLVWCNM